MNILSLRLILMIGQVTIRLLAPFWGAWSWLPSLALLVLFVATGCSRSTPEPITERPTDDLHLVIQTDSLSVWAAEADKQTAQDVAATIQDQSAQVCSLLQTGCQFDVVIEIYPDQATFDEHVMNPEMRGYFAISGFPNTIQMVSPANPAPNKISYKDGVLIAIHEFAHLALDEVNPNLPVWLDEGTAVYAGPHQPYTTVCQLAFPFELTPSFRQLRDDYDRVPAPDLFAYTAVDFIASIYGMEKLNLLLRTPEGLENVLGVSGATFQEDWHQFMHLRYHNYKPQIISALGIACIILSALVSLVSVRMFRRRRKGV